MDYLQIPQVESIGEPSEVLLHVHSIIVAICTSGEVLQEWRNAHISTCYTRGRRDPSVVSMGISLVASTGKPLLIIVAKRHVGL